MRLRLLVGTRLRNTEGGIAQDIADASAPRALEKEREREREGERELGGDDERPRRGQWVWPGY